MYHYVRDVKNSNFPEIKALSIELFKKQINYILKNYSVISMEDFIAALKSDKKLPKDAALLTFDDGYADHFVHVFPILKRLSIKGSFFPPGKAILEHQVLDVNKIHFILASVGNKYEIIERIFLFLDKYRAEFLLQDNRYYFDKLAMPGRFDSKEVIFIKRILQRELPEILRKEIIRSLFNEYVTKDEACFSEELYMNINQVRFMRKNGMFIGSHGFDHCWLGTLDEVAQKKEIELSLNFLHDKKCSNSNDWVMCYPYGSYNDSLLSVLKKKGCIAGLTAESRIADISRDNLLTLPRLDTNDLPMGSAHGC